MKSIKQRGIIAWSTGIGQQSIRYPIKNCYNAAVVPELKSRGIIINDLWTLVDKDREGNIRPDDGIHLTDKAIALCGKAVADIIKKYE